MVCSGGTFPSPNNDTILCGLCHSTQHGDLSFFSRAVFPKTVMITENGKEEACISQQVKNLGGEEWGFKSSYNRLYEPKGHVLHLSVKL